MTDIDRRTLIEGTGVGLAYATFVTAVPAAARATPPDMKTTVQLTVNGKTHTVAVEDRTTLLDTLCRDQIGLTGTRKGCDRGECGACTVHIDGRRAVSCMTLAVMQAGRSIATIEGIARGAVLHPVQRSLSCRSRRFQVRISGTRGKSCPLSRC